MMNWIVVITLALTGHVQGSATDGEALEVMTRLQDLLRSDSNVASYSMRVETPDWQRSVRFDVWDDKSGKRVFIRIASPKKDKDTAFLKRDGGLWMYLPKLERNIRIPPSMMLSSWMGSSFTYDDLTKVSSTVDDYTHRVISKDQERITIESTPKPDAAIVWGKLIHVFTRDGMPISEDFYDEEGKKRRTLRFEDVREMDGRKIPVRWVMRQLDGSGKQTTLNLDAIQFDPGIENSVFTHANMQKVGR